MLKCSTFLCVVGLGMAGTCGARAQAEFGLSEKGLVVEAGAMGRFTMEPPVFNKKNGAEKPVFEMKSDTLAEARYSSGTILTLQLREGRADFHYTNAPAEGSSFKFSMLIPISFNQGGRYAFDTAEPKPLPEEKGAQFVQHGNAHSFTIIDPVGQGFTFVNPGGYQGLQDNRNFGWAIFDYQYQQDTGGKSEGFFSFSLKPLAASAATPAAGNAGVPKTMVDRFGQSTLKDYSWKVTTEDQLKEDYRKQTAEAAAYTPNPALDVYGGLVGSGEKYKLKKTGFFHTEQVDGRHVLVDPEGNLFFQLGVCGIASTDDFTLVKGREKIYEWIPDANDPIYLSAWREGRPDWGIFSFYIANWIRKFGKPFTLDEWTDQVVQRLRLWGFNSGGAFSRNTSSMKEAKFPTVAHLNLGKGGGIEVLPEKLGASEVMDPFHPGTEQALEVRFAKGVAEKASDPLIIGYFLSNEPHWEELPKKLPTYKASKVAAKGRLVQMLKEKYQSVAKFNQAWEPAKPFADFESMNEESLFVRTRQGAADMQEFYELYLETFFSMVQRVFRKYDSNHLLIGSRFTPGTANNETAMRISGKYTDVVSINYYTYGIDQAFLARASEWSGNKPVILSEWFYSAADTGLASGKVRNQEERALAYRNYLEQSAVLPSVVGLQWFIYTDQSITGRFFEGFHGEGNNTGLVDVTDRPYEPLIAAARLSNARVYDIMMGKEKPFSFDDPRFNGRGGKSNKEVAAPKALPGLTMDGSTTNWPGRPAEPIDSSRLVNGTPNPKLRGDFRLCWDEQNLYFLIQVKDPTPGMNTHKEGSLWMADGVELFVGGDTTKSGSMLFSDRQILLGAGARPEVHVIDHVEASKLCPVVLIPEVGGDGYTLAVTLPWKVLGIEPKSGTELLFDVAIDNSNDGRQREQQLTWNGTGENSKDRGVWGRLKLVEN